MKKEKLIYAIPVFIFLLFGAVALAEAAVTWQTPTAGATIAGAAQYFNVSTVSPKNLTNCSINIYSANTANSSSSAILFWTEVNGGALNQTNATYSTLNLEDNNVYTLTGTCYNATAGVTESITPITITIDNTVPSTPTVVTPIAGTRIKDRDNSTLTFTMAVVDSRMTGDCTIYIGPNSGGPYSSYTAAASGSTCSYTWTVEQGSWEYYMSATDGTNTTISAKIQNIDIVQGISSGGIAAAIISSGGDIQTAGGTSGAQKTTGGTSAATVLLLAAAGVILWKFVLPKKKK